MTAAIRQRGATRADIRRMVADAHTASNLRSIAIARSVMQSKSEAHRDQVRAHMAELAVRLERTATADELQAAAEILATDPQAPQGYLFRGNR